MVLSPPNLRVLISAERVQERVRELGAAITRDYRDKALTVVVVLKGSFVFAADLVRHVEVPLTVDFLGLSSYGEATVTSGVVEITQDLTKPVVDRDVLVVEDIVDTGLTMQYLLDNLRTRKPRSVRVCTLLHKPVNQRMEVPLDYVGFTIDDHFVVGYGLDYAQHYRNLPFIGYFEDGQPPR